MNLVFQSLILCKLSFENGFVLKILQKCETFKRYYDMHFTCRMIIGIEYHLWFKVDDTSRDNQ